MHPGVVVDYLGRVGSGGKYYGGKYHGGNYYDVLLEIFQCTMVTAPRKVCRFYYVFDILELLRHVLCMLCIYIGCHDDDGV